MKTILLSTLLLTAAGLFAEVAATATAFPPPRSITLAPAADQRVVVLPATMNQLPSHETVMKTPDADLEKLIPEIHRNMAQYLLFGRELHSRMLILTSVRPDSFDTGRQRAASSLVTHFNSQVGLSKVFQLPDGMKFHSSIMRGDNIYFTAHEEKRPQSSPAAGDTALFLYRLDFDARRVEVIAKTMVSSRLRGRQYDYSLDVNGRYAAWAAVRNRNATEPYRDVLIFDLTQGDTVAAADFPMKEIRSVAVLGDFVYLLLDNPAIRRQMLIRCSPDGSDRKVLFNTAREEAQNWFDTGRYREGSLYSNPARGTLLLRRGSAFYEINPETMESVTLAENFGREWSFDGKTLYLGGVLRLYDLATGVCSGKVLVKDGGRFSPNENPESFEIIWQGAAPWFGACVALQGNNLMSGNGGGLLVNLLEPDKSPPLLIPQHSHRPAAVYPHSDKISFWAVQGDGTIYLATPKD